MCFWVSEHFKPSVTRVPSGDRFQTVKPYPKEWVKRIMFLGHRALQTIRDSCP